MSVSTTVWENDHYNPSLKKIEKESQQPVDKTNKKKNKDLQNNLFTYCSVEVFTVIFSHFKYDDIWISDVVGLRVKYKM